MEEPKKKKRVMTRVGDIFCIVYEEFKVYFQFIAVDMSELNSTTIRVFQKRYPLDYEFNAEEVVAGEVQFYAHTCIQAGLKKDFWTKVGKSKDVGNLDDVLFRRSEWTPAGVKSYRWWVGGINKEYKMIGELTEEYKTKAHMGWVVPPLDIVKKVILGEYDGYVPF